MINLLRDAGLTNVLVNVTGESDTGKTSFALQTGAMPEETVFLDCDVKGRATVKQVQKAGYEFSFYRDVVDEAGDLREIDYHNYCLGLVDGIEELEAEARRVIVWDTWEPFEKTFKPVVANDPKAFKEHYSPMGQIKGAEEWLASFDYEARVISRLVGLCDLLILVNHVKNYNIGGRRVAGKFVPDCKKPIMQKSLLRVWLRHNPDSATPIGLVLKRLGKITVGEKGIRTVNVLPRKVTPREGDESLWDTIRYYWENPVGNRAPELHEIPDEFEMSILDGTLTDDQKMAFKAVTQQEDEEEELLGGKAKEMEGRTVMEVAKELGVSIPEAARLMAA